VDDRDSTKSDIGAAEAAGIPSVLVVRDRPAPLVESAALVLSSSQRIAAASAATAAWTDRHGLSE
jgi:hypothetical protein